MKSIAYQPSKALHPGLTLQRCMEAMSITADDLSASTGWSLTRINSILKGNTPISLDIAQKLNKCVGGCVIFWMNLEHNYQETLKRLNGAASKGMKFTAHISTHSSSPRKYDIGYTFMYGQVPHVITHFWEPDGHYVAEPIRKSTPGTAIITPLLSEADIDNCPLTTGSEQKQ